MLSTCFEAAIFEVSFLLDDFTVFVLDFAFFSFSVEAFEAVLVDFLVEDFLVAVFFSTTVFSISFNSVF